MGRRRGVGNILVVVLRLGVRRRSLFEIRLTGHASPVVTRRRRTLLCELCARGRRINDARGGVSGREKVRRWAHAEPSLLLLALSLRGPGAPIWACVAILIVLQ